MSFYSHSKALMGTNGYKDGFITHIKKQVQGYHSCIRLDFNPHVNQPLNFSIDYLPRKAILGNTHSEHASQF